MEKRIFHSKLISTKSAYKQSLAELKRLHKESKKQKCPSDFIDLIEKRILKLEKLLESYGKYKTSKYEPSICNLELLVFERYIDCGEINEVVTGLKMDGVKDKKGEMITVEVVENILKNKPLIVPIDCERLVKTAENIFKHNNSVATVAAKGQYPLESIRGLIIHENCSAPKGIDIVINPRWIELRQQQSNFSGDE